jgi:hypothetical protein
MTELFSLSAEVGRSLKLLKKEVREATFLSYLWWYIAAETPYFFYELADTQIKVMASGDNLVLSEEKNGGSRAYEIRKPPGRQLDKPAKQACILYLSSLVMALRKFGDD